METPKHQSSTRVGTSLGETAAPSPTAFVMKPPTQPLGTVPPRKPPEMGADRLRRPSFPMAGLKPIAEGIRRVPPFGSPKREGQHDSNEAKRRRRSVVRLIHPTAELMPVSIDRGAGGVSRRSGWGAHGRPGIASLRPTADRASRGPLNRFAGAFAGVRRHRIGGSRRRVSDTSARGLSDAAKGGEPAYSLGPRFAVPRRRLAGGLAPSDPPHRQRRIVSAGRASEAERAEWPARARSRKGWPPLRRRRFIRATPARPSSRGASGGARGTVPGHGKGKRADNNGRRDERAGRPLAFPRAVVRLLEAALDGLPARTAGWERPRSGGEDGAVRLHPPRCRSRHAEMGGRSHPRPRNADRHRRSAGRGATASAQATWGGGGVSHRRRDFVSGHPQSAMGTRGSASGAPIRVRANAFRAAEQGAGPAEPRLAEKPRRRDVSNAQIVQSIIEKGIE